MLRSILVGLDGSSFGKAAIELGIDWARRRDAMIVGLGVVDEPTIRGPEAVPILGSAFKEERDEQLVGAARRTVEQLLEQFAIRCADAGVACKLLEDVGLPAQQLCLEAQRYDLVVLGKKTFFQFETQAEPDETITFVLRNCPRPVVAVPEKVASGSLVGNSVVVAYDGSVHASRTLQAFQTMGLDLGREVHVVAVNNDHAEAVRNAERAIDFLRHHNIRAFRHVATESAVVAAILERIKRLDAGLLVMGAYGKSTIKEFLFGSTTRQMLTEIEVPVLLNH